MTSSTNNPDKPFSSKSEELHPKTNGPLAENDYEGAEVRLCRDGVYRWRYDLDMFRNPSIFILVFKIFFLIIVIGFGVFGILPALIRGNWEGVLFGLKIMGIMLGIFLGLSILGYLVVAWMYGGKYCVIFEMDEKKVTHIQLPAQAKKAQKVGIITAIVGILAKKPSTAGAGLLSASRTTSTSPLESVRKVKAYPRRNLIKVNQLLNHNQVYARKEDFDFVLSFIQEHCPQIKGKK